METAVWGVKSQLKKPSENSVFDCMIAEFLLSDGRHIPKLETTLLKYGVNTLEELAEKQMILLSEQPELHKLFTEIEMPLASVLWKMEQAGILLDTECLQSVGKEIDVAIKNVEAEIKTEVGFEINLNSSVQVGNYLADKAGVPLARTKTGRFATSESEIAQHVPNFPIIQKLLTYRELSKLRSTYIDSLISKVDENGRVHTNYNQVAVSTGRLSSSNPNLQNIPVTSVMGQKIKSCFVATKGKIFLSFDYSQQELRILAHLTGEEALIEAFNSQKDVHKTTASQIFNVKYEEVTKEQRSVAKTINFGIIYGMSSYGLGMGLTIPVEDAQKFIDAFYKTYPKIKTYYDQYLKDAKINGFAKTLLGRKRYVFEYPGQKFIDNSMKRVLMNYPIQGTAADLMKKAMIEIDREVISKEKGVQMLLQIHDDLVFEVPDSPELVERLVKQIKTIMCSVYPLVVPIEVEAKSGKNWGEMASI